MKKIFPVFALLMILILLAGCMSQSAEDKTQDVVDNQQTIYNQNQPMRSYNFSVERGIVLQIYDFRITKLVSTWSVWVAQGTGEPIDMCASKGYPIPYNTSLTNPLQTKYNYSDSAVIAQAEPNGLFPGGSTSATWVLCVETDGTLHPRYVESEVNTYDYPIAIQFDTQSGKYRIVRVGDSSSESQISIDVP